MPKVGDRDFGNSRDETRKLKEYAKRTGKRIKPQTKTKKPEYK